MIETKRIVFSFPSNEPFTEGASPYQLIPPCFYSGPEETNQILATKTTAFLEFYSSRRSLGWDGGCSDGCNLQPHH